MTECPKPEAVPYNPFARGAAPVGVRTIELRDESRAGRALTVELWYPAAESYRGRDASDAMRDRFAFAPGLPAVSQDAVRDAETADGRFPLVMHNHGYYGHRRVNTLLCTHLASHGYVVASNDVPGNTLADLMNDVAAVQRGAPRGSASPHDAIGNRRPDASFVIESLVAGGALPDRIDASRVGVCGQSVGGWTSLGLRADNPRIAACFAMQPLWGVRSPVPGVAEMGEWLRLEEWHRPVPTFVLAGELDPIIILQDLRELYTRLRAPKAFASLRAAGHWHFGDNAEKGHEMFRKMYTTSFPDDGFDTHALAESMRPFADLCGAEHAVDVMRSLCLAHMDAYLKGDPRARAFLEGDLSAVYRERGIALDEVARQESDLMAGVL